MVPDVLEGERRHEEWSRRVLKNLSQLPLVTGDTLALVWDIERDNVDDYYVIAAGSQLVWRERARTEDWERFNEVKRLLKRKYKGRFASLTPTEAAAKNLLGGNTFATLKPT